MVSLYDEDNSLIEDKRKYKAQRIQGSWKMVGRGHGRRHGHGNCQKTLLHLYNNYFSYLMLFLQQSSLPVPGVDLFIALIHL